MRHAWVPGAAAALLSLAPAVSEAADAAATAYAAAMQGRKAVALAAAGQLPDAASARGAQTPDSSGWELTPRYAVLVRFGLWDELIALEPPPGHATGERAGFLYGRGIALAARGRVAEARSALAELERLGTSVAPELRAGSNTLRALIGVATAVVAARIAATEYRMTDAVAALEQAAAAEDRLNAAQPPDWFFPVRDLLGAQLLLSGRAAQAEGVFREDLARHPGNGWALYGLAQALRAQARIHAATAAARTFKSAWAGADVRLVSSAFWFGGPDTTRCECERTDAIGR